MARVELSRRKVTHQNGQSENSSPGTNGQSENSLAGTIEHSENSSAEKELIEVKVSLVVVIFSFGIFKLAEMQLGIAPNFSYDIDILESSIESFSK